MQSINPLLAQFSKKIVKKSKVKFSNRFFTPTRDSSSTAKNEKAKQKNPQIQEAGTNKPTCLLLFLEKKRAKTITVIKIIDK